MSKNNPKGAQIYETRVRTRMNERLTNENLIKVERAFGYSFKNIGEFIPIIKMS